MSLDRARLHIALDALKACRERLDDEDPRGLGSLRRVARALRDHAASNGSTDLAELSEDVQVAQPERLEASIELLLNELRRELYHPEQASGGLLIIAGDGMERSLLARALGDLADQTFESGATTEAWATLQHNPIAAVVLDLSGDSLEGRIFLSRVRGDPTLQRLPVVVLSIDDSAQTRSECLALGAHEFFAKPVSDARLSACLATLMGHDDRMFLALSADPVSGLPAAFELRKAARRLQHEAEVSRTHYCVVLARPVDVPTSVATRALRTVAGALCQGLAAAECFAWQGDTLAILLPGTKADHATHLLSEVAAHISSLTVPVPNGGPLSLRVAIGGVEVLGMSFERSVSSAQRMLDLAEQAGASMPVITPLASAAPPRHRVLVAEDDRTVGEIIVRTLERAGLDAVLREDGLTALELARDLRFDMVITDIVMPFMDGLRLIEELREIPRYKRTPILVLTSLNSERHVVQGFEIGADAYITKPFNPRILGARVKSLLARNSG